MQNPAEQQVPIELRLEHSERKCGVMVERIARTEHELASIAAERNYYMEAAMRLQEENRELRQKAAESETPAA